MLLELVLWNLITTVKKTRWLIGVAILLVSQCTVFADVSKGVTMSLYYTFGVVPSLTFLQAIVFFLALRKIYEKSSIHFFSRAGTRQTFWIARVLSNFILSYGVIAFLLIGNIVIMRIIHGPLFYVPQGGGFNELFVMASLLSLSIASSLVVLDVLQLYFKNTIASYLVLVALLFLSGITYVLPTEPFSRIVFLVSPFLRTSLEANVHYHMSPIFSIFFQLLLLCAGLIVGNHLFKRKDLV